MFYPSSVSSARAMMLFNLGSAYCLRSEYEKARKCLNQVGVVKQLHPSFLPQDIYRHLDRRIHRLGQPKMRIRHSGIPKLPLIEKNHGH